MFAAVLLKNSHSYVSSLGGYGCQWWDWYDSTSLCSCSKQLILHYHHHWNSCKLLC